MPITENSFTAPELKAALEANRDALLPVVRGVLGNDFKFVVQDEAEHNTFKTNFEADLVGRKTSEWATQLEKDVEEMTGIKKKDAQEKYYDYFKRATGEALAERNTLKTELDSLRAKGNPSEADKKRIQQLEQGLQQKETEYRTQLQERDKRIHELQVGTELQNGLAKLRTRYKKDIPQDIIDTVEGVALQSLIGIAKIQDDGKITFLDAEGKPIVDPTNYQPQTGEKLLETKLASLIDTTKKQEGAGSGPGSAGPAGQGGGAGAPKWEGMPATVKTRIQLTEHLLHLGFTQGSDDFNKLFDEHGKGLPLK